MGTGLGLSMVHGLAAQLGGGLTIVSEPGRGTAVELWLPVSLDPLGHPDETKIAPTAVTKRLCALLVDDEPLVRMGTASMLEDLGYDVVEANSGEQALRLLDEGAAPDLRITDYLMPGMNGAEVILALRARKPAMPVLIVTGYAEPKGIEKDVPRLTKPFRSADLAQSIANLARDDAA